MWAGAFAAGILFRSQEMRERNLADAALSDAYLDSALVACIDCDEGYSDL